ncbi:MAG: iron-sulfur cluster assembly scaffold protein [Hyphomicrobiaceae bacterium]|nr:iron-sulfur cluster assembly scaffold protein [Hyphomicrobiaceae bacterium]
MADLDQIYNTRILELAAAIPRTRRLAAPDATASANSKLCGSAVTVDIVLGADGRVSDFGQQVKACLLGQAAASVLAREAIGLSRDDVAAIGETMRAMLKEAGSPPAGRWADLAVLEPVRDYPGRHASTLLAFEATLAAIDKALAMRRAAAE